MMKKNSLKKVVSAVMATAVVFASQTFASALVSDTSVTKPVPNNANYLSASGDFENFSNTNNLLQGGSIIDVSDAGHGKVLKTDGTVANVRILGSKKDPLYKAMAYWDCAESVKSIVNFDIKFSTKDRNFDYRIYDENSNTLGMFFFDKGGNFVVCTTTASTTTLQSGQNETDASAYYGNVIAYPLNAAVDTWYTITILVDKAKGELQYWVDDKYVGTAYADVLSEGKTYGKQIGEIRISSKVVSTTDAAKQTVYIDNLNVASADAVPQIERELTLPNANNNTSITSTQTDFSFTSLSLDSEYIVQYDVDANIGTGTGSGLTLLLRSGSAVINEVMFNNSGAVYTRAQNGWYWLENKDYNTAGESVEKRNYQLLFNAHKNGTKNTVTYYVNPQTGITKVWIDGQYLGQNYVSSTAPQATFNFTILTHKAGAEDTTATISNIKVGYASAISFVDENNNAITDLSGGKVKAKYSIKNIDTERNDMSLICAVYDKAGNLKDVKLKNVKVQDMLKGYDERYAYTDVMNVNSDDIVKAFLWEDTVDVNPVLPVTVLGE